MLRMTKWFNWSRSNMEQTIRSNTNPHSLEQLKVLCRLLEKNQTVNENNRNLLVETLRQIAEILIWGDQNDSTVFDFFLEKNMLYFFLNIMKQKCGGYVCTQLLQTLNILFENIKNETSLYYLLSNNHVNSIIIHKFDFSDEEVLAYYISFLKTLSFKLNSHTIHFFFNEHTADFPLYTEAIKFFNHQEKMVRIAVRTLTLNVLRVQEKSMLRFIGNCTAVPYFSNLSWFIGNHILDLNNSLTAFVESVHSNGSFPQNSNLINRLEDLMAEHLDHLHYLNDILLLNIEDLNNVLADNLLYRLIIPLYVQSFLASIDFKFKTLNLKKNNAILSPTVAIFLMTQIFLIISYGPLLKTLILSLFSNKYNIENILQKSEFTQPNTSLEVAIEQAITSSNQNSSASLAEMLDANTVDVEDEEINEKKSTECIENIFEKKKILNQEQMENINKHIDWKKCSFLMALVASLNSNILNKEYKIEQNTNANVEMNIALYKSCHSPEIIKLMPTWDPISDDRIILFTLSLISSIITNKAIKIQTYANYLIPCLNVSLNKFPNSFYNTVINSLLLIIRQCSSSNFSIRLITFELAVYLFRKLTCYCSVDDEVCTKKTSHFLSDHQIALLEQAIEDACHILRQYYSLIDKSIFTNLFEKQAKIFFYSKNKQQNPTSFNLQSIIWSCDSTFTLEQLFMDATLLLPQHEINVDESNFHLCLPSLDYQKARYIIQVFFTLRLLSCDVRKMMGEPFDEMTNEFTILFNNLKTTSALALDHFIDLENCDLNACSVTFYYILNKRRGFTLDRRERYSNSAPTSRSESPLTQNNKKRPQFMAILSEFIIVIEPDEKRYGWGIVRFIARLQDIEKIVIHSKEIDHVTLPLLPDKDDNKSLYLYFNCYQISSKLVEIDKINIYSKKATQNIVARFQFNDTVRSLVARNNLHRAHKRVLDEKTYAIANFIDFPTNDHLQNAKNQSSKNIVETKSEKNDRIHNHPILNRTYAIPGVAVPSKFAFEVPLNTKMNTLSQQDVASKKRYAYPPAEYVSNKSKLANTKIQITEHDRKRKKKLKFPNDETGNEEYGIPLNDLSPKSLRKNNSEWNVENSTSNVNFHENYTEDNNKGNKTKNKNVIGDSIKSPTINCSEPFDI